MRQSEDITIPAAPRAAHRGGIAVLVVAGLLLGARWQRREALGTVFGRDLPDLDWNEYQAVFP